ncbi:MAG: amino acid amidase [Desulfitibacter sp. BRH_c19]|nr:MAG: amino acid amidase [Desulfitibacter sp. BRH_c19]
MKIYISADMEGVTGASHWDEVNKEKEVYQKLVEQMTSEVKAVCDGANNAGALEVWVKDAHDTGRNIDVSKLPRNVKYSRVFSGHPFLMMQDLDSSFDAIAMIGYHSFAGSNGSPLAHTLDTTVNYIIINDQYASEFLVNAYTASLVNVPVILVSGDEQLCNHVLEFNNQIKTIAVNKGIGKSTISIHPALAVDVIKEGIESALKNDLSKYHIELPDYFVVEISFFHPYMAYKASFYPGAEQISPNSILFKSENYFDVLRMFSFVI